MPKSVASTRIKGVFERPAGSDMWWIDYRVNGVRVREKIGSKTAAHTAYSVRRAAAYENSKLPKMAKVKFGDLIDDALVYAQGTSRRKKLKDMRTHTARLTRLKADFGEQEASSITARQIDKWLDQNTKTGATANRYRAAFSKVFRVAVKANKVLINPVSKVEKGEEGGGRMIHLQKGSADEKRLFDTVREMYPHRMPELTISLGTGMRLSEQYTLTWSEIDFDAGYIRLDETKNGSHRDIPMNAEVLEAFNEIRRRSPQPSNSDKVFDIKTPRKWFGSAIEKAKIREYTWHCNRHSFCSRLARKGVHVSTIQKLAGHKTISVSARYIHMEGSAIEEAVKGIV
ncbi:site-specific integrase [soil metagenome]